ncbi:MAG: hypothetical protein SV186_01570 [Candidatus Nanohaloarchaea archaeon]|nr:hypothetical protein [Candidatus Nanohaloarchaea archaeon]
MSWSNGEIHYHADFEVLVQNDTGQYELLELVDPGEFCKSSDAIESSYMCIINDRTGSTPFHEHDDMRIHLEGTFRYREDATLAAFFDTFGGQLSNERLVLPTPDGVTRLESSGNKTLKIAVQRGVGGSRHWCVIGPGVSDANTCRDPYNNQLATAPSEYVISPWQSGPPLDNIMIIYDGASAQQVLDSLKQDNTYQGFKVTPGTDGGSGGY